MVLVKLAVKKGDLLNPFESFILRMKWLLQGISDIDVADRLHISNRTSAETLLDLLDVMYVKITSLIIWLNDLNFKFQWQCVSEINFGINKL